MRSEQVVRSLARNLKPVRRLYGVEWRTLLWAGFALLCVSIGTYALGPRSDLSWKIRDPAYLCESALLVLIFVFSARIAFHLSVPGAERSAGARTVPIAGLLAWVFLVAAGHSPDSLAGAAVLMNGWPCVWRMTGLALAPTLAVMFMLRRAASLSPGWTGWFALLSAGSLAILGTQILCAKDDLRHLFLWHFGPVLAAALVGIHLGRWLLTRASVLRVFAAPWNSPPPVVAVVAHEGTEVIGATRIAGRTRTCRSSPRSQSLYTVALQTPRFAATSRTVSSGVSPAAGSSQSRKRNRPSSRQRSNPRTRRRRAARSECWCLKRERPRAVPGSSPR